MPESANTFRSHQQRGRFSEDQALQYFLDKGFHFHGRNQKIGGVEIDLILRLEYWLLVEVKTLKTFDQMPFRLRQTQKMRLCRAREYWQSQTGGDVALQVAFVHGQQTLALNIEDFE